MYTETKIVKTICHGCYNECGVLAHIKNGKLVKVEGDPENPVNEGVLCGIGLAATQLVYNPDRLRHPLKRIGYRGEGKWKRISWEEALDTVAGKIREAKERHGAEAIAVLTGTERGFHCWVQRFANCLGTPNFVATMFQCWGPRFRAHKFTFGCGLTQPDYENTRCTLIWGCNPFYGGDAGPKGRERKYLIEALDRGVKLIVVDPRFTKPAAKADIWIQIRPGTDAALALGMLNVIIDENLYDKDFVEKWTTGFEKLRDHVRVYTPEKVAEITWVPAETIRNAARMYSETKPACIRLGVSCDMQANSFQNCRSIYLLDAITGNFDVPGGDILYPSSGILGVESGNSEITGSDLLPIEQKKKRLGAEKYPIMAFDMADPVSLWHAIKTGQPYPIKVVFIAGNNTLGAFANTKEVKEALSEVDFLVVTDLFMTPTAEIADIVLPAATWLEKTEIVDTALGCHVFLRQKVIEVEECWPDVKIISELSKRLGLGKYWWNSLEEMNDYRLKPIGIKFEEFKGKGMLKIPMKYRKYEKEGFTTPSGKVELYSNVLEEMGLDPLPVYREPPESPVSTPEIAKDYPLILTTGSRYPIYFHSEFRQLPWLREIIPSNEVEIHPKTASDMSIRDGDMVKVESIRGSIIVRAKVTEGIHPKVVNVRHGWWFPSPEQANVNYLTDNRRCDPAMGSPQKRGLLCRVIKTQEMDL